MSSAPCVLGFDKDGLEEEYNQALATNIVQELLYQKRRKPPSLQSQKAKPPSRESLRNSASSARRVKKELFCLHSVSVCPNLFCLKFPKSFILPREY